MSGSERHPSPPRMEDAVKDVPLVHLREEMLKRARSVSPGDRRPAAAAEPTATSSGGTAEPATPGPSNSSADQPTAPRRKKRGRRLQRRAGSGAPDSAGYSDFVNVPADPLRPFPYLPARVGKPNTSNVGLTGPQLRTALVPTLPEWFRAEWAPGMPCLSVSCVLLGTQFYSLSAVLDHILDTHCLFLWRVACPAPGCSFAPVLHRLSKLKEHYMETHPGLGLDPTALSASAARRETAKLPWQRPSPAVIRQERLKVARGLDKELVRKADASEISADRALLDSVRSLQIEPAAADEIEASDSPCPRRTPRKISFADIPVPVPEITAVPSSDSDSSAGPPIVVGAVRPPPGVPAGAPFPWSLDDLPEGARPTPILGISLPPRVSSLRVQQEHAQCIPLPARDQTAMYLGEVRQLLEASSQSVSILGRLIAAAEASSRALQTVHRLPLPESLASQVTSDWAKATLALNQAQLRNEDLRSRLSRSEAEAARLRSRLEQPSQSRSSAQPTAGSSTPLPFAEAQQLLLETLSRAPRDRAQELVNTVLDWAAGNR